jgi:hypothetical protein
MHEINNSNKISRPISIIRFANSKLIELLSIDAQVGRYLFFTSLNPLKQFVVKF